MLDDPSLPECLACGACCFSRLPTYVRVSGDDFERLADEAESLTVFVGNRCYLRMVDDHCAALAIRADAFHCTAYERRPSICRTLERGSAECRAERDAKAERAEAARARAQEPVARSSAGSS